MQSSNFISFLAPAPVFCFVVAMLQTHAQFIAWTRHKQRNNRAHYFVAVQTGLWHYAVVGTDMESASPENGVRNTTTLIGRLFAACKKFDGREFGWEDSDSLPVASRQFLLNYGWKQWMADSHAADKRENFPDGSLRARKCGKTRCGTHIMERHTVITTGVGLPGEKSPTLIAQLSEKSKALDEANAVVDKMRAKLVAAGVPDDEIEELLAA